MPRPSTPEAIKAFNDIPARLDKIEWLDEDGKLVAQMLAVSVRFTKRYEGAVRCCVMDAADVGAPDRKPDAGGALELTS